MKWPKVNVQESFESMEKRLGIVREINDIRPTQLGSYPSESFYADREIKIDLKSMRRKFDRIAASY